MSERISPNHIAEDLRRIAANIDNSENPSLELVTKDIATVAKKLQGSDKITVASQKIAKYMMKVAEELEELDVSMWDTEQGEDVEAKYENAKGYDEGDKLESAIKMLKRSVDRFLKELLEPGSTNVDSEVVTSAR